MSTLCLYTDSALIHTVSFQLIFSSSPNGESDFSIFSASKVRTGADRLWAPFQVISHDCSEFFVDFLHQFIDYNYWFCLIFIVSSSIILSGFRISTSLTWMFLTCEGDAKERMLLAQSKIRRVNLLEIFPEQVWTSEQFGIPCSVVWVALRCLVAQKSCDPNIILQFMKITTTRSLAGILSFHYLAAFFAVMALVSTKKTQLKRRKLPKMNKKMRILSISAWCFHHHSFNEVLGFTREPMVGQIQLRSFSTAWKDHWALCDGLSASQLLTQCAYVHFISFYAHDLAAWLDVVWPSLNFKQMSPGWDVFLAVQAANLLVDSAYCPVTAHLRKETIFTAKHSAIILTAWGLHPP